MIHISLVLISYLFTIIAIILIYLLSGQDNASTLIYKLKKNIAGDNTFIELIIYLLMTLVTAIIFTILPYFLYHFIDPHRSNFDKVEKSLQVGVSVAGFLSIIITVKIYRDTDKRQAHHASIMLFDKFRDERFAIIRERGWEVREKFENNQEYRKDFISVAFRQSPEMNETLKVQSQEEKEKMKKLKEEIRYIRDLMEFYHNLIIFKDTPDALIDRRYFYYGWWRPFLYEMAALHDERYKYDNSLKDIKSFDYHAYKKNISYIEKLHQIDEIFGFSGVPYKIQFHKLI